MKRNLLVGLLCLAIVLVPTVARAAYISNTNYTADEIKALNSRTVSYQNAQPDLIKKSSDDKVTMIKFVSEDALVLTFHEKDGFTQDTYSSILSTLKIVNGITATQLRDFQSKYASINSNDYTDTSDWFQVYKNPNQRMNLESNTFYSDDIIRVKICFDRLPSAPSPSPSPSSTPSVKNPSTGDMNMYVVTGISVVSALGIYFSIKKLKED